MFFSFLYLPKPDAQRRQRHGAILRKSIKRKLHDLRLVRRIDGKQPHVVIGRGLDRHITAGADIADDPRRDILREDQRDDGRADAGLRAWIRPACSGSNL